jgi:hypothetical protein
MAKQKTPLTPVRQDARIPFHIHGHESTNPFVALCRSNRLPQLAKGFPTQDADYSRARKKGQEFPVFGDSPRRDSKASMPRLTDSRCLRALAGSHFELKNGRVLLDLGRGSGYFRSDDCTAWAVNRGTSSSMPALVAVARRLPPTLVVAVPLNLTLKRTVSLLAKTPCVFSRGVCQGADIESDPARKETACSPRRAAGLRQGCRRFDRIEEGSTALARQTM